MPYRPKHPCGHPGCAALVPHDQKYCDKHRPLHSRPAASRGYDASWQKARKRFLLSHPLCEECMAGGRFTKATVVDHVRPHRGNPALFWDENNWRALCKECHDKKTGHEDSRPTYDYDVKKMTKGPAPASPSDAETIEE